MEVISRSYYAEKIDSWLGSGQIIVLIGQRRVGKSYVMKDFIARHAKESDANIIYIDKEKRSFRFIHDCLLSRRYSQKYDLKCFKKIEEAGHEPVPCPVSSNTFNMNVNCR